MKKQFLLPVPRAIYYMSFPTALKSVFVKFKSDVEPGIILQFENKFSETVGMSGGIAVAHARTALYYILQNLRLPKNSEVLMSSVNIPDMVNMIRLNDLKVNFFDYNQNSFSFDLKNLEEKMTKNTKVIFLTILSGIYANFHEVFVWARKKRLIIILDLTQSFNMNIDDISVAQFSDYSIYSLCDLKDIHTHRGGMIVSNRSDDLKEIRKLVSKNQTSFSKHFFLKFIFEDLFSLIILNRYIFTIFIFPWVKILARFNLSNRLIDLTKGKGFKVGRFNIGRGLWGGEGDLVRTILPNDLVYGFTSRQAKIGLTRLAESTNIVDRRISRAKILSKYVPDNVKLFDDNKQNVFWKFPILVSDISKWQKFLLNKNIDCAPTNLPLLPGLKTQNYDFSEAAHMNAQALIDKVLYIPAHEYLSDREINYIGLVVREGYTRIEKI